MTTSTDNRWMTHHQGFQFPAAGAWGVGPEVCQKVTLLSLFASTRSEGSLPPAASRTAFRRTTTGTGSDRQANYGLVEWNVWLPVEDRLVVEDLMIEVPNVPWNSRLGSGVKVSNDSEADLLSVWESHLEDVGRLGFRSPDELPGGETYPVGAAQRVEVNRYERDPRARAAALEAHGFDCIVCGFNFESAYGERGHEYVHVHHLVELSTLPEGYEVDPLKDLVPVCANCHAMIHRRQPALAPDQLRALLANP